MDTITYSKVAMDEVPAIADFLFRTMKESHEIYLSESEINRDMYQKEGIIKERLKSAANDEDKYMGVAKENEKVIGAISARILDDSAFIDYLYIDKNYRGRGIGPALTKRCIAALYAVKKLESIGLQVYAKNQRAIEKYRREGFVKTGQKQKDDTLLLLMNRPLSWYEKIALYIGHFSS